MRLFFFISGKPASFDRVGVICSYLDMSFINSVVQIELLVSCGRERMRSLSTGNKEDFKRRMSTDKILKLLPLQMHILHTRKMESQHHCR